MEYILFFLSGIIIGNYISFWLMRRTLFRLVMDSAEVMELPELTTELVDSSIRLYESGTYLCQGATIEEVAMNFFSVKNIKLAQVRHEEKNIWFVDGKVQTSLD